MLLGSRVIIDWHNLGFTVLGMRLGSSNPLVKLAAILERWSGRRAYAHLCVTEAMKLYLIRDWAVRGKVVVLHDRPPVHFRRSTHKESHRVLSYVCPQLDPPLGKAWTSDYESPKTSLFTTERGFREDRPALVVSSTSWTVDEDFDLLLKAAAIYERRAKELNKWQQDGSRGHDGAQSKDYDLHPTSFRSLAGSGSADSLDTPTQNQSPVWNGAGIESTRDRSRRVSLTMVSSSTMHATATRLPKLLLVVTGKGELRSHYEREIARLEHDWDWVRIRTAWLEREDYPILLGSADIGISLHTSSSGLDLPMKVVDMLGCGLPVCALGFPCLDELIQHDHNGLVFYKAEELATQLETLLAKHPERSWLATSLSRDARHRFPRNGASGGSSPIQNYNLPPSPTAAAFTLLPSPVIERTPGFSAPEDPRAGRCNANQEETETWQATWKRIVRPLLVAADAEDIMKAEAALRHRSLAKGVTLTMFRKRQGPVAAGSKRRPLLDGSGRPKTSFDGAEQRLTQRCDSNRLRDVDNTETDRQGRTVDDLIVLRRSPRSYLRRRKSGNQRDSPLQGSSFSATGSDGEGDRDGVPDIHVSAPTT